MAALLGWRADSPVKGPHAHHAPRNVSVVLVNFRGTDDTIDAIEHLRAAGLAGGAARDHRGRQRLRRRQRGADPAAAAATSCWSSPTRTSASPAAATSASRQRRGEYVAFLNNDARPDAGWIRAAVDAFEREPDVGCGREPRCSTGTATGSTTSAPAMTWFGQGYKPLSRPAGRRPTSTTPRDVLFGTGSAMFVRAPTSSSSVGGFDERYFMFFEDVDLGWRLNLPGYRFALRAGVAGLPQAPRLDVDVRLLQGELPPGAQRAVHACTRTSTTRPSRRSSRRAGCSPSGGASPWAASTRPSLDLRQGGSDDPTMARSTRTTARCGLRDRPVRRSPARSRSGSGAHPERAGHRRQPQLVRLFGETAAALLHRRALPRGATTISRPPSRVTERPAVTPGPRHHRDTRSARRWPARPSAPGTWPRRWHRTTS